MIYFDSTYISSCIEQVTSSNEDLEIMGVVLSKIDHPKIIVINAYRPPNGKVNLVLDKIPECCDIVQSMFKHSEICLAGDLNINLLIKNAHSIRFSEICGQFSLYNLVNTPTRLSVNNFPSLSDVCISNSSYVYSSGVIEYNISDYLMVYCVSKMSRYDKGIEKQKMKVRSYKNYNLDLLSESLVYYNWGRYYAIDDVDLAWQILCNQILDHTNYYAPYKDSHVRTNQPQWFITTLLEASIERDRMYKAAKGSKSADLFKKAKKKKNEVKTLVSNARSGYY